MLKKQKKITQTFNDGVVSIYSVGNISAPGDMPKEGLTLKMSNLHYEERTVGMSRYWTAMQNQAQIERIIRVPRVNISTHDVAKINDLQYDIVQAQVIKDVTPPCIDLSLQRLEAVDQEDEPVEEEEEVEENEIN